jgi:predicted DNA-binding transcriptional regulator AlpA
MEVLVDVEVRFRLAEVTSDFDEFVRDVADKIDSASVVATHDGVLYVTVSGPGKPLSVALDLATRLEGLGSTIDDIDDDLVDLSEIAARVGRSREAIRLWSSGKRGAGGFPLPVGVLPGSVKVWDWSSVNSWLALSHPTLADPVRYLDRVERSTFRSRRKGKIEAAS